MTTLHTYISVKKIPTKVIDGTMIVEEYLGTSDGAARSPPLVGSTTTGLVGLGRLQGWAKEWTQGCVNPASWLPLDAGGGRVHAT